MADKIISMLPQLLCKKLARDLGDFLDNRPGASPAEMLETCNQLLTELGDEQDEETRS